MTLINNIWVKMSYMTVGRSLHNGRLMTQKLKKGAVGMLSVIMYVSSPPSCSKELQIPCYVLFTSKRTRQPTTTSKLEAKSRYFLKFNLHSNKSTSSKEWKPENKSLRVWVSFQWYGCNQTHHWHTDVFPHHSLQIVLKKTVQNARIACKESVPVIIILLLYRGVLLM